MPNGLNTGVYVRSCELVPIINRAADEHESDHPIDFHARRGGGMRRKNLTGNEYIAHATGLNPKRIWVIRTGKQEYVTLDVADRILTGLGLTYLLANGTINVVDRTGKPA
jgi:hypothetical protein